MTDCSGAYETNIVERFWLMFDSSLQLEYSVEITWASLRSEKITHVLRTLYTVEQAIVIKTIVYDYLQV